MIFYPLSSKLYRAQKIGLALGSLALAVLGGCEKKPAASAAPMDRPAPLVTVAPVITRDVPVYLDEIGRCVAREVVAIQPQVSGRILKIHFADGAMIKRGDLLFTIDPRPHEAELAQRQADLAQSRAMLDLAKTEFARVESLFKQQAASQQEYDVKKNTVRVTEAQIQSNLAAIEVAKLNLEYCFIHSPMDGRAGERLVDEGNVVTPDGKTPLLVIPSLNPIYADFTVTEEELPRVRAQMAGGTLKTEVRLPADTEAHDGKLTFLDNAVQNATGTVRLRATLPNAGLHFWPGQFVNVRLVLSVLKGAPLVPGQATQISQQGSYVYVVKDDSTAELRPVKLGQRHGELVTVLEGLQGGERVVLTGHMAVVPGAPVRIDTSAPPSTAPSGGSPATRPGAPATAPADSSVATQPGATR
jgi:multidrug efflux system membrane fusion protein